MQLTFPKKAAHAARDTGLRDKQKIYLPAGCALAAFAFAQCRALGVLSPFCVAFTAAAPFAGVWGGFVGGAFGSFFALPWQDALKYTAALLLTALFRLLLERRFPAAKGALLSPVLAGSTVLTSALVTVALRGYSLAALLYAIGEGALAFFGACFLFRALHTPLKSVGLFSLGAQDLAALLIAVGIFLMCSSGFSVGKISPVRIFACVLVLFAAHTRGLAVGALCGACAGAALCVDPAFRFLLGFYCVGGLAAGVFSSLGQYVMSVFFALSVSAAAFVAGMNESALWCLGEVLLGSVIFFLLPGKWLESAREYLKRNNLSPDDALNRPVAAELRRAAISVEKAADLVCETGSRLDHVVDPEIHAVFAKLQQNICYGCGFKSECWSNRFQETANDVLTLSGVSDQSGPTKLERRCPRASALRLQVEQSYTDFVSGMDAKAKIKEARGIVGDQFRAVATFLEDLAAQVADSRVCDNARSRTLKTALADEGVYVDCLQYLTAPDGRVSIELIMLEDAFELDQKRLRKTFEHLTGRRFLPAEVAVMDLRTTLTFEEQPQFDVLVGQAQIPMLENGVCGDCVRFLTAPNGERVAVLSDGMGTGARAAVDSALTAGLMERLLAGGFDFPCALHMVNSALLVKSTDESLATLDGVRVNLYTGEARLFKAGAALSFLRRGDQILPIEAVSMPLGILRELDFAALETELQAGDIVLLASDGVTAGDCGWINDELLAWSTNNMEDLAAHIASLARLRAEKDTVDDISVAALKVVNAKPRVK